MEPGTGGPPTYGTDSASPPSYDEATGWSQSNLKSEIHSCCDAHVITAAVT